MFAKLGLSSALTRAVEAAGYTLPTPVQSRAIPLALLGRDLMVAAQTGTGKTASFALPILELLFCRTSAGNNRLRPRQPRSLVLTPTRELAAQVHNSFLQYSTNIDLVSGCIFGGVRAAPQVEAMAGGVDVLVACPGRLLDLMQKKQVDLEGVKIFVLDEADRMLDMGFIHDVKKVMTKLPQKRQNLLYSATFSPDIIALAERLLHSPERIEVTPPNSTVERIQQAVYHVPIATNKKHLLAHLITRGQWAQVLVFTRTKHGANKLAEFLYKQGISSAVIHGNKSQTARTKALADFKSNEVRVLVATDIAARGLDINQLPHVVNFELPDVEEDYVHRIGRTGRAGRDGEAVSLVSPNEIKLLRDIEKMTKQLIPEGNWMGYTMPEISKEVVRKHERDWNRDREKLASRFSNAQASKPPQPQQRPWQNKQKQQQKPTKTRPT